MKLTMRSFKWIGALALGMFIVSRLPGTGEQSEAVPMPLILSKVQALGELRTARYTYQHVFEQTSSRKPQEWAQYVPGAASIVLASTRNKALASSTAQVDAGIDLGRAVIEGNTIVLPQPTIYRPVIDTRLHQVRPGVFWRDDNMAEKADQAMEYRVKMAAKQQGIAEEAKRNALAAIQKIAPGVKVEFR